MTDSGAVAEPSPNERGHVTSRDIAAAAGVSQATVSNALNRPHLVAPETLSRIQQAIDQHGFVVNSFARGLRLGGSRTLGVIVLDLSNPFWGEVTRGIEEAASARKYSVLLGASDEQEQKERQLLQLFEEHRVSGILVASVNTDSDVLRSIGERGTRVVLLNQDPSSASPFAVSFDHALGAERAARYLVSRGHRRIAFINGPHTVPWCLARSIGFERGIRAAGLDPRSAVVELTISAMTAQVAEPAVEGLLALEDRPTAVFCVNDMVAVGVLKQLISRNVRVPDELSVVGFDDSYFSSLVSPSLTTVRQQSYELGKRAAEMAMDPATDMSPSSFTFAPEIVERESVRFLSSTADSPVGALRRPQDGADRLPSATYSGD